MEKLNGPCRLLKALIWVHLALVSEAGRAGVAKPINWIEIPYGKNLRLSEDLSFNGIYFPKGAEFEWNDQLSGGDVPVVLQVLVAKACAYKEIEVDDMFLVGPESHQVGVTMSPDCAVEFYIEGRDFVGPSLFYEGN